MKYLVLFVFQCIWSIAAEPPLGKEISLTDLAKALKSYENVAHLEAAFHQKKILKDLDMNLKSEGKLSFTRPDQVTWEILKPSPLKVELNSQEIRLQNGKDVQTIKAGGPQTQSLQGLVTWLKLDANEIYKEDQVLEVGPRHYIFKPRKPEQSPFASLDLTLSAKGYLQKFILHENSGDLLEIEFDSPKITLVPKK